MLTASLPIALPQLTGAHSDEKIAEVVLSILQQFGISSRTIGYFVLDNASNNDTTIHAIAQKLTPPIVPSAAVLIRSISSARCSFGERTQRSTITTPLSLLTRKSLCESGGVMAH
jgi:hypothetical protein